MREIELQIVIISIICSLAVFFLSWRLFSKIGGKVSNEAKKIKEEYKKGDKMDE